MRSVQTLNSVKRLSMAAAREGRMIPGTLSYFEPKLKHHVMRIPLCFSLDGRWEGT